MCSRAKLCIKLTDGKNSIFSDLGNFVCIPYSYRKDLRLFVRMAKHHIIVLSRVKIKGPKMDRVGTCTSNRRK